MTQRPLDPKSDQSSAKRAARERLEKLKASLVQAQNVHRERIEKRFPKKTKRGRLVAALLIVAAIAVLVISRCSCTPTAVPQPDTQPQPSGSKAPVLRTVRPETPKAERGKQGELQRGQFTVREQAAPEWFEALRRQVLARSPRLSDCLKGAQRGGGVRWSATFNPANGRVSDHSLLLINTTVTLSEEQQSCLVDVLSSPQYSPVAAPSDRSQQVPTQPLQIHMVIEF
ncbi:MAG: hypothetical protein RLZZ488_2669 [Pseudomonadota bacterium]